MLTGVSYLGQAPPGDTAELFAPGIVSNGFNNRDMAMMPDGSEIYYAVNMRRFDMATIMTARMVNGKWGKPEVAPFAKDMNFERDYNTALSKAKSENKVLMMVLSSDYCPWCRKFENKTLSSKLIKPRLDTEVISLVVDKKFDVDSYPTKFKTQFTPVVFFIDPKDESILNQSRGYIKKKESSDTLDYALFLYKGIE
jgi:hypothetical protein